jgi:hypothetical protein
MDHCYYYYYYYYYYYVLAALYWVLAAFQILDPMHSPQDSSDEGSAVRQATTYTHDNTNTEKHTYFDASTRIGTHDPSFWGAKTIYA